MIKKILLAVAVALPMFAAAQAPKFGVINTQSVMEALPDSKQVEEQILAASKKYEDEFAKLQEEMNKAVQEFQGLGADTPETIKQRRQQEIQDLYQKSEQFRQTATQDLQRQHEQLMAPVVQKVTNAINSVGKEKGMTFIFEQAMPLYVGTDVVDITPLVKTSLGLK